MINMFLSNNPLPGGYKFVEFVLFSLKQVNNGKCITAVRGSL